LRNRPIRGKTRLKCYASLNEKHLRQTEGRPRARDWRGAQRSGADTQLPAPAGRSRQRDAAPDTSPPVWKRPSTPVGAAAAAFSAQPAPQAHSCMNNLMAEPRGFKFFCEKLVVAEEVFNTAQAFTLRVPA